MAVSNITLTKAMLAYAKRHELAIPKVSIRVNTWGKGKRTLAWRVSQHLHNDKKHVPVSQWRTPKLVEHFFPMTVGDHIAEAALSQRGVHETPYGSNDGPQIREYQRAGGIPHPESLPPDLKQWCGCFVAWCARHGGYRASLPSNPAYVPSWASWKPCSKSRLKRGGYVCLWHSGHVEVFIKWVIPYTLADCVGGNTSPVGKNANGGMVASTRRWAYEMNAVGNIA